MDKTLILWKPDRLSGVWMEEVNINSCCLVYLRVHICVCLLNCSSYVCIQYVSKSCCHVKRDAVAMAARLKCCLPFLQTHRANHVCLHLQEYTSVNSNSVELLWSHNSSAWCGPVSEAT